MGHIFTFFAWWHGAKFLEDQSRQDCRSQRRWRDRPPPLHILADQLTLSQPGRQIMSATLLLAPRIFRPSYGPGRYTRQRSTWEGPHHLNFFDDHASGIGYLRFRQQKARLATSFLNVPTANLGLIPWNLYRIESRAELASRSLQKLDKQHPSAQWLFWQKIQNLLNVFMKCFVALSKIFI